MKRYIYIGLAIFFIIVGIIGSFVPLLPTTPFLLISTYLFMRSSTRGMIWLLRNRYLSPYIYSYISKEGMPLRIKIQTLVLLWGTILATAIFGVTEIYIRLLLIVIAIGVTIHICIKKTKKEEATTIAPSLKTKKSKNQHIRTKLKP